MKFDTRIFVSRAKNFGWRASDTDFIFFIDDDNVLGEGTLQPLLETISASESMGAVMPGVLYRSAPEVVWVYATPFRDKRLGLNLVGRNSPRNPSIENRILRTDALPNASIVRRRALVQVGGFDENLVVNSSMDMCQRLKLGGWKVVANPASLIYHDVEVPGQPGYWAAHGASDPELVRYNLRDWYLIMKRLHPEERSFRVRFTLSSISFVLPNLFAYLMRGKSRMRLIESIVKGYIEGLQLASSGTHGYTD
jgi:GT2 family glycosyltransferase